MTLTEFLQHMANGVSLGSLYALIAIGYTMVYGILRLINFAHGDIFMIAAYVAFFGIGIFSLPWWVSFILAVVITAFIGALIERAGYRPLRNSPRISVLISAIGISFLLENLGLVLFGGRPKAFYRPPVFAQVFLVKGVAVQVLTIYIPLVTIVLLACLLYLVHKTKTGMAMRACSRDFETARLMAINVDRIVSVTFVVGSALAAVGGIMWSLKFPQIHPLMGIFPGLKCFIAAVLGGIGNITGAVIGGFILGILEIMLVAFFPALSGYRDAFAFVILILILLFRPTGILGETMAEKV
ncbi:MAG: ABC-type transporter, integral membrane subunit [Thermoanaerobacterales bacterium 50_218]|nr:MAG: ABC-type transporter, integral membrane subunit [Thermoanaerobacterales bacterium 50_218]HAA90641.1 branched-chain amino acid ABC transporter permease [Peptococcaceae bacterium]